MVVVGGLEDHFAERDLEQCKRDLSHSTPLHLQGAPFDDFGWAQNQHENDESISDSSLQGVGSGHRAFVASPLCVVLITVAC